MAPDKKQRKDLNRGGVIDVAFEFIFAAIKLAGRVIKNILN